MGKRKTQDEYIKEAIIKNPNVEILGMYINNRTPILHRCKIDKHEWEVSPGSILSGHGCPVCSGSKIGNAPEYINSIWTSEYKEYFSKYITEDQMKLYMPNSMVEIEMVCPDCGNHKWVKPCNLLHSGFGCLCSDGQSYPNKFIYSLLNQLNIEFIPEYSPKWIQGKRYDVYIPSLNCIIENHGMQHYEKGFSSCGGRTLQEEQDNDKYKRDTAISHGIKHYIIIDCRESSLEWIKTSILKSDLIYLLSVDNVDWSICNSFATSSFVKEVAKLWNKGFSLQEIAKQVYCSTITTRKYLCQATKLKLCTYSKEECYNRGISAKYKYTELLSGKINFISNGKTKTYLEYNNQPIEDIKNGIINKDSTIIFYGNKMRYNICPVCENNLKAINSVMCSVCREKNV